MFKLFKSKPKIKNINIKNNEVLMINGKLYIAGCSFTGNYISLTCIDKYKDIVINKTT